jgi:hypothetical protein
MAENTSNLETPAFQFINLTGDPTIKNLQVKRRIKSHLMRKFRYETREGHMINLLRQDLIAYRNTQKRKPRVLAPGRVVSTYEPRCKDTISNLEQRLRLSPRLPRTSLDSFRSIQFDCLPILMTPTESILLDYC